MKNKYAIKLIESYQASNNGRLPRCKYYPTCSHYAKECYLKYNFFKASLLTSWRLIRCNPFSKGGYDPVPLTKEEKKELINNEESTKE